MPTLRRPATTSGCTGVVRVHDETPSPVQAIYQRKQPPGRVRDGSARSLAGGLCNRTPSWLVTTPPTGVGSQTRSRYKAYGNGSARACIPPPQPRPVPNKVTP